MQLALASYAECINFIFVISLYFHKIILLCQGRFYIVPRILSRRTIQTGGIMAVDLPLVKEWGALDYTVAICIRRRGM